MGIPKFLLPLLGPTFGLGVWLTPNKPVPLRCGLPSLGQLYIKLCLCEQVHYNCGT